MRVRGDAPHDGLCPSNDGQPGPVNCDFCERLYSADARGYTRGWSAGHAEGERDERERIDSAVMPILATLARHACTADNWEQTDALIRRLVMEIKAAIRAREEKTNG